MNIENLVHSIIVLFDFWQRQKALNHIHIQLLKIHESRTGTLEIKYQRPKFFLCRRQSYHEIFKIPQMGNRRISRQF